MERRSDGSVLLSREEAENVAKVLHLGRDLAEQLEADEHHSDVVEDKLARTLDFLEELGVSADELVGKLDQRQRSG